MYKILILKYLKKNSLECFLLLLLGVLSLCIDKYEFSCMDQIIRVKDMLATLDMRDSSGEHIPCSIEFVTANEKTGEGGEIIFFEKAVQVGGANSNSTLRNPKNAENFMRNIVAVGSDRITKIDPWCVRRFNGMEVLL